MLFFQLSLAARVVRDAPETPTKAEGADPNAFNINEALSTLSQGIQKAFSKENVDVSAALIRKSIFRFKQKLFTLQKFMENLGETGEKLKQFGQGLINKAQETAADISNSGKKDEKST